MRESVERVAAEESNDNLFGRPTPCNEAAQIVAGPRRPAGRYPLVDRGHYV